MHMLLCLGGYEECMNFDMIDVNYYVTVWYV